MRQPIITFSDTPEDKSLVIVSLSKRIIKRGKARQAFDRMFGSHAPHQTLERIFHLNSRALISEFNERIFRLLSFNPHEFYAEDDFLEGHSLRTMNNWKDGTLLVRWERSTLEPNPHHIVGRSRGGTSSRYNLWQFDRKTHEDFHLLFQNLTPNEQARMLLYH